jgi:hypothetical protein
MISAAAAAVVVIVREETRGSGNGFAETLTPSEKRRTTPLSLREGKNVVVREETSKRVCREKNAAVVIVAVTRRKTAVVRYLC